MRMGIDLLIHVYVFYFVILIVFMIMVWIFFYMLVHHTIPFFCGILNFSNKKKVLTEKNNNQTFYYGMGISTMLSEEL